MRITTIEAEAGTVATPPRSPLDMLLQDVVAGGFCIGCGVCAAVPASPIEIHQDRFGAFQARLRPGVAAELDARTPAVDVTAVCPFGHRAADESEIGADLYGHLPYHLPELGHYGALYAGWVEEGDYRSSGSSGGLGSWVLVELLERGLVDRVIHVGPGVDGHGAGDLFRFRVVDDAASVRGGAHSRYYPVEMSRVLAELRAVPGRYAIVGVPCFVKAVRLLARHDPVVASRVAFTVAIFCGHLKTRHFASYLAWQMGVPPTALDGIDFRIKDPARPANEYATRVVSHAEGDQQVEQRSVTLLRGTDWGFGYFKYRACDFCDDVAGETADICVGDAWLPPYRQDWRGTNVVVVRHPLLQDLLEQAKRAGRLHLEGLTPQQLVHSQESSFRHRRFGLASRLLLERRCGRWTPPRRAQSSRLEVTWLWHAVFGLRMLLRRESHRAFQAALEQGDLRRFERWIRPYQLLYLTFRFVARRIGRQPRFTIEEPSAPALPAVERPRPKTEVMASSDG